MHPFRVIETDQERYERRISEIARDLPPVPGLEEVRKEGERIAAGLKRAAGPVAENAFSEIFDKHYKRYEEERAARDMWNLMQEHDSWPTHGPVVK